MAIFTPNPAQREADLSRLDEMISALEKYRDSDLAIEHLKSARIYLLGAMPREYLLSLEASKSALASSPNNNLLRDFDDAISNLIARASPGAG